MAPRYTPQLGADIGERTGWSFAGQERLVDTLLYRDPSVFMEKGSPVVPVGLKIPVDQLTPGSYRIEIRGYDGSGVRTAVRQVDFDAE